MNNGQFAFYQRECSSICNSEEETDNVGIRVCSDVQKRVDTKTTVRIEDDLYSRA